MKTIHFHKLLKHFVFTLSLVVLPYYAHAEETIKIGVAGPHTGEFASYGLPTLKAVELAADYMNEKGGVLGKQVEVIAADEQCKPEFAPNAATNLLSENVVGVIGMICSGATKAGLPILNSSEVILISPASTTPELTLSKDYPYFLRTIGHDNIQGGLATEFIMQKLKAKKIALLHDNGEYGKGYVETVSKNLKENYPDAEIVIFETITPGASDYSAIVRKLRKEKADVLVWGGYHPEASKVVNNMYDLNVNIPLVGPDSLKTDTYIQSVGNAVIETYASAPTDTTNTVEAKKMHKAFEKKFNVPVGAFGDNAYAAAIALLEAINKAGTTDSDAVLKALKSSDIDTPIGKISFDENGDIKGIGMTMYKISDGKFIPEFELK